MRLFLLVLTLWATGVCADDVFVSPEAAPVYSGSDGSAPMAFRLRKGEKILLHRPSQNGFYRVRARRGGRLRVGYLDAVEVDGDHELNDDLNEDLNESAWGFSGAASYSALEENGRSFTTQEGVKHTMAKYTGSGLSAFLAVQTRKRNFWRLSAGYRQLHFSSVATSNVVGTSAQAYDLKESYICGLLQKAWNPLRWRPFYFGLGAEVDKGLSLSETLDGSPLPTTSADLAFYLGAQIFTGLQWSIGHTYGFFFEARLTSYLNQSPPIFALEPTAGLTIWL